MLFTFSGWTFSRRISMKISVLIAEDDPDMRYVLKKVVEEVEGVEVTGEAGDGTEAIKLVKELFPRVVFVDIGLPGKNGIELAREIFDNTCLGGKNE